MPHSNGQQQQHHQLQQPPLGHGHGHGRPGGPPGPTEVEYYNDLPGKSPPEVTTPGATLPSTTRRQHPTDRTTRGELELFLEFISVC